MKKQMRPTLACSLIPHQFTYILEPQPLPPGSCLDTAVSKRSLKRGSQKRPVFRPYYWTPVSMRRHADALLAGHHPVKTHHGQPQVTTVDCGWVLPFGRPQTIAQHVISQVKLGKFCCWKEALFLAETVQPQAVSSINRKAFVNRNYATSSTQGIRHSTSRRLMQQMWQFQCA